MEPSLAAAEFAEHRNAATLILTGSKPILEHGSPWAITYGMSKAAVHHLAQSIFEDKKGLSSNRVVCLLPTTLDTPANRANMPHEDFSKWTSTDAVALTVFELCTGLKPKGYDSDSVFYRV